MLGSPDVTAYDLRFRLLNIPVRVHPLFWLVMLVLSGKADTNLPAAVVFIVCALISVLVHELGHGLSSRMVGDEPMEIVLYAMGGYCAIHQGRLTPWQRIFVLISGPGAGFLLLAVVLAVALAVYGVHPADALALIGVGNGDVTNAFDHLPRKPLLVYGFRATMFINFWWGVVNLMPIWPLDGGQITGVALTRLNYRDGMRWAHVVSLLTAAAFAIWFASREDYFMALWFGYFGFINYQMLQALHQTSRYSDDPEWWHR